MIRLTASERGSLAPPFCLQIAFSPISVLMVGKHLIVFDGAPMKLFRLILPALSLLALIFLLSVRSGIVFAQRTPASPAPPAAEEETGWRDAQDFYNKVRTYPGKDFPENRYIEGAKSRESMARANLFVGQSGFQPAVTPTWQFIGPTNTGVPTQSGFGPKPFSGRLDAVAYDPTNPGTYYVGSGRAGLWKTTSYGATFVCLSNNWSWNAVSSITVDPANGYVYVGTGDFIDQGPLGCQGLLKSTDGGSTWAQLNVAVANPIGSILIDPDDHNVITIAAGTSTYVSGGI
jgi:hypothetical protein